MFESTLDREISRSTRTGELVSLLMFDIDHFKALNDNHGHDAGDQVLKAVAKVLASCSRDFDTVARYGGEEFGVVLADCSLEEAFDTAERLRDMVSGLETVSSDHRERRGRQLPDPRRGQGRPDQRLRQGSLRVQEHGPQPRPHGRSPRFGAPFKPEEVPERTLGFAEPAQYDPAEQHLGRTVRM